jgi:SAM-dependent methyltransferase
VTEPTWFSAALGVDAPAEGSAALVRGQRFVRRAGILRAEGLLSETQGQTGDTFGFKWQKRDTFDSAASLARMRAWLVQRYGEVETAAWWSDHGKTPLVVDAGCGAGMSGLELFGKRIADVRYLAVDISSAVDVAAARFAERGLPAAFMQADITNLPLADGSVDVVFSEGVMHHTDSTERALKSLARLVKPGGRFMFYVYKKKGPIREFTDDYIREKLRALPGEQAWDALMPLTKLGKLLGDLDVTVDVPEAIDVLEIPKGPISLQRLFYWHVFKAFHHTELTLDELNHINFDWYAPANAHRQTPEAVASWCADAGLEIERQIVEEAGMTIIARKAR